MNQKYPLKKIYNPLNRYFTVKYDINNDGNPVAFTIYPEESGKFPLPVANHMMDHLAKVIGQRDRGQGTWEDAYQKALDQIDLWRE